MKLMTVTLGKKGLSLFFREWQIPIVETLFRGTDLKSIDAYRIVQKAKIKISRSSVIFFLNDLVKRGWAEFEYDTGKGGYHKVYSRNMDVEGIYADMSELFVEAYREAGYENLLDL